MSQRLAFASRDGEKVDEHFGSAPRFQIFELDSDGAHRTCVLICDAGQGHDDHRLTQRIEALQGCRAIFCTAIGKSALQRLQAAGIEAIRVNRDASIALLIANWQQQAPASNTSSADASRFTQFLEEGWQA